jgi:hypothetical protein
MATIANQRDIELRATTPRVISYVVAPTNVSSLTFTIEQFGARLVWPTVNNTDLAGYDLRIGGTSWATSTSVFKGIANSYFYGITSTGSVAAWIKAYNTSGMFSATEAGTTIVVPTVTAPTLTYTIVGENEQLSWLFASSANFTLDHFEIRTGTTWAGGTFLANTKSTLYQRKADFSGSKRYWVAGVDAAGNVGTPNSIDVVITAPGVVTGTRTEVVDNNALIYWTIPSTGSLPIARYEIRRGASWASPDKTYGSNADSTFTSIFEQASGTYTYWIAAYDSAGNINTPVSLVATINQPPDYILRQTYNSIFADYSGVTTTLTNMYLENGYLLGPVVSETFDAHFTGHAWTTPDNQIAAGYPLYAEPSTTSGSYTEVYDTGATLTSVVSTVLNTTLIAGTVTPSCQISWKLLIGDSWTPITAGVTSALISNFRYIQVVWSFACTAGANLIKVTGLTTTISNKLRTGSGTFTVTTASTGVVVPFNMTPGFVSCDTPICQATVSGGGSVLSTVVDFSGVANPTNFTVYLYNSSGTKVTGSGSWTARGY